MKYYKTSKFTKAITSTGFVTIVACFLIIAGAITWFALSRNNSTIETPSQNNSEQSYPDTDNSYNSIVDTNESESDIPATDVNDNVSDVPYSEDEQETTSVATEPESPTFILPIENNVLKGYSDSALQYSTTYGDMRLHTGVDILCDKGSNIKSVGSGTVKSVVDDATLGKIITIEYLENITVKYCGMGSTNVKENDTVSTGDIIGTSGEIPSECADNPHIHIEVLIDGESVSPLEALGLE